MQFGIALGTLFVEEVAFGTGGGGGESGREGSEKDDIGLGDGLEAGPSGVKDGEGDCGAKGAKGRNCNGCCCCWAGAGGAETGVCTPTLGKRAGKSAARGDKGGSDMELGVGLLAFVLLLLLLLANFFQNKVLTSGRN